jgi:hypothetical protein
MQAHETADFADGRRLTSGQASKAVTGLPLARGIPSPEGSRGKQGHPNLRKSAQSAVSKTHFPEESLETK